MNRIVFLLALFFSVSVFSQTATDPLKVLFVGNSITYFNNLPQTFKQIADEQGYPVSLDQHTPGGTGFVHHVVNNALYEKFRNTVWDYVILQPGSNESPGFSAPIATTIERGQQLKDSIIKYSPCASIYYYEISYGIVNNSTASFQQYLDRQILIKDNLTQMGNATDIPFVPVGECFKNSMQTDENQFLWVNYGNIHPNPKGSFLAACSFFNALFKQPIVNSAITGGLSIADANYLRSQAETTTLNNLDDWLINDYTATANFTYEASNATTVNFTNTSTHYDGTVLWNFGDGVTSTENNPTHVFDFSTQNSYTVLLTAYKGCKEHHKLVTITKDSLGILDFEEVSFKVYPNPTSAIIYFQIPKNLKVDMIKINDVLGKSIPKSNYKLSDKQNSIDIHFLPTGVYFIQFSVGRQTFYKKFIKQ